MKRIALGRTLSIALLLSAFLLSGCGHKATEEGKRRPCCGISFCKPVKRNPQGTKEERIAYHKWEVERYEAAILREDQKINRGLRDRKMDEVRQAKNRKAKYEKKLHYHQKELEKLAS